MANRERNLGINIRVTPDEKKKIMRYANKCRLNISEYIRQVAVKNDPKEFVPKEIEDSFLRIKSVLSDMDEDRMTETDPVSKAIIRRYYAEIFKIVVDTLQLMRDVNAAEEE